MPAEKSIFKVDSFTDAPFGGNPAGVCLLDEEVTDEWMQAVAREMNVSETAFVGPQQHGFSIRFFTPAVEVPLCGHATLASAHILFEERRVPMDLSIDFASRSGPLSSRRETGAAHAVLGPFWAERLGKQEMIARQVSSRGGVVRVRAKGDRVDLLGKAVTILRGGLAV